MRTITTHHTNDANRELRVEADERNPDNGNASHEYRVMYRAKSEISDWTVPHEQRISFQNGPIKEVGINGITNEVLLAIVIDRLEGFQSSKWACQENADALGCLNRALAYLESRTKAREARGVEGTHQV